MAEAMEVRIPCERCNSQVNIEDWSGHTRKCYDSGNNQNKSVKRDIDNDKSVNEGIPCEFCDSQIRVDDYESHTKNCANAHRQQSKTSRNIIDNEPTNELIPCEYCDTQISIHDLQWHTTQCATNHKRPTRESSNDEIAMIPCEYCNTLVSALEFDQHTKRCADADRQRINDMVNRVSLQSANERIACEYCTKPYPIKDIEVHERQCRRRQEQAALQWDGPQDQTSANNVLWPKYWDPSPTQNFARFTLDPGTEEYKFVADNFHKTLPSNQISKIERIQNRRWYRQYVAHKEDFIERYGNSTEQWLFHGCRQSQSAEAIVLDCFNRSHAVRCAVGQGIYFATQSATSHTYTQPDGIGLRHMFMACVLVGKTTAGTKTTRVCPPGFDTTGGGNVFVTYHDAQAYGQYLIAYR